MACKSYLLLLAVIVMSVSASARRLPVVVNHEIQDASEPMPPSPIHEPSVPSPPPIHEASVPRPSSVNEAFNSIAAPSPFKGSRNEQTNDDGNGKLIPESTQPGPLAGIGLIPESTQPGPLAGIGLIPIIPGGDGSFHFALGPINFGGNIGFGGSAPGYAVPYNQPHVVVSPYTSPYATSSPNQPFVTGSRQPSPGYYGPASGYGQPSQGYSGPSYSSAQGNPPPVQYGQPSNGYYSPYASARGNAPSSAQIGSSFFNRYN